MSGTTRSASRPSGSGDLRPPRVNAHLSTTGGRGKGKPPARQSHPDFPAPEVHPLFDEVPRPEDRPAPAKVREQLRDRVELVELVDVQGTPHRVDRVLREPGDEARAIHRLTPQGSPEGSADMPVATVADCGHWYECDCAEYHRDWQCEHIDALIRRGILTDPLAVGRGRQGGERCR